MISLTCFAFHLFNTLIQYLRDKHHLTFADFSRERVVTQEQLSWFPLVAYNPGASET
jgi:hypothetical protein